MSDPSGYPPQNPYGTPPPAGRPRPTQPSPGASPAYPAPGYPASGYPGSGYPAPAYPGPAPGYPASGYARTPYPAPGAPAYQTQQQYGSPGPGGTVMLDCSYNRLGFFLAFTGPHIRVDGYGRDGDWGRTAIPLPPGNHTIEVHTRYMGEMGKATMTVAIQPGQPVPVFYRAPAAIFFSGAIGYQPQPTPGMWMTWVMFAVAALIIVLAIVV